MKNANIVSKQGPKKARKIKDMKAGERGFCLPWAYNPETQHLNEENKIHRNARGTVELPVYCTSPGKYEISFEGVSFEY